MSMSGDARWPFDAVLGVVLGVVLDRAIAYPRRLDSSEKLAGRGVRG
jgi:hypothetical protein